MSSQAKPVLIKVHTNDVSFRSGLIELAGEVNIPANAQGLVIFAHGSGSSRHSKRNQFVAKSLNNAGVATLLFDLLTQEEEEIDSVTRHLRFDLNLLAERLIDATKWIRQDGQLQHLRIGYFGASTGAGAALMAAAEIGDQIGAVVSRGGRPDLAGSRSLSQVKSPTLFIVGERDEPVVELNREAYQDLIHCYKEFKIIPGATHLFPEPGTLEQVAILAADWFHRYL